MIEKTNKIVKYALFKFFLAAFVELTLFWLTHSILNTPQLQNEIKLHFAFVDYSVFPAIIILFKDFVFLR